MRSLKVVALVATALITGASCATTTKEVKAGDGVRNRVGLSAGQAAVNYTDAIYAGQIADAVTYIPPDQRTLFESLAKQDSNRLR